MNQIVKIVARHPGKTATELAKLSKRDVSSLSGQLCKAAKDGLIDRREEKGMRSKLAWRYYAK